MATNEKLNLHQWLVATGISTYDLARRAGVTPQCIAAAAAPTGYDIPISAKKAEAICKILSEEHGKPIRIEDVRDLRTL
jgi:DNA-binding Xre family transcriptional regulator